MTVVPTITSLTRDQLPHWPLSGPDGYSYSSGHFERTRPPAPSHSHQFSSRYHSTPMADFTLHLHYISILLPKTMLQEDKTRMVIRKVIQEREAPLDPSISYPCLKAHVIKTNSVESSGARRQRLEKAMEGSKKNPFRSVNPRIMNWTA